VNHTCSYGCDIGELKALSVVLGKGVNDSPTVERFRAFVSIEIIEREGVKDVRSVHYGLTGVQ
jgi:predicted mannosyl-3-phosphoglycerate phosphatase (HAD superfamily)